MIASDDSVPPRTTLEGAERLARREGARRHVVRRRRRATALTLIAVMALVALVINSVVGGSGSARPSSAVGTHASAAVGARRPVVARAGSRARSQRTAGFRTATRSPGSLPQTHAYPSGTSAQFKSLMASLWAGIVHDSLTAALPAFFPKGAYVQLKAIVSAGSDWSDRLVHDYGLDVTAAHALLGPRAVSARLVKVEVPSSYGHWIGPGVCYNSIGYYEMPNARVVYRDGGRVRSFGIASMISWRGVWYVVHLGAILRSSDSGTVDEPASGPGSSIYSGTC